MTATQELIRDLKLWACSPRVPMNAQLVMLEAIGRLSAPTEERQNHFAALEKRGLYMPPGILTRLIKVANCEPREQVYPDDARYLAGVIQELSGPRETTPSPQREKT